MKILLLIFTVFILGACNSKTSKDYNVEAEEFAIQERFPEAIALLDEAIKIDPEYIHALINRAVLKYRMGNNMGAIEDFTKVILIDPDNTLSYFHRGLIYGDEKEYTKAILDLDKAIQTKGGELIYMDPVKNSFVDTGFEFDVPMEEMRFERGEIRYEIDSIMTAFEDFTFCINKKYSLPESHWYRGMIHLLYGNNEAGCLDLKIALKLGDPDAEELINKYCK